MLFNSSEFLVFFAIVWVLYWKTFNENLARQNILLLIASYFFYGWWDWRFLSLIFISSVIDFFIGIKIDRSENIIIRRNYLFISLASNLGILAVFKYFNFFSDSLVQVFNIVGLKADFVTLNIILPVGISFYTFQTLSYTLDIYNKKLSPTKDFIAFSAFVAFFPQLVAGPIERASNLLPQFLNQRIFIYNTAFNGFKIIVWGLFLKIVIADNASILVDRVFNNIDTMSSLELALGAFFFSFQIYGDFAGYSYIAIGLASLMGFKLMTNFRYPYLARNISDFWRRWHISLSSWFRDYLYIPLGGSRRGLRIKARNILITFLVSGLWHGANWTFVAWGGIHGIFYLLSSLKQGSKRLIEKGEVWNLPGIIFTFFVVTCAWIFFRNPSISDSFDYIFGMMEFDYSLNSLIKTNTYLILFVIVLGNILILTLAELNFKKRKFSYPQLNVPSLVYLILIIIFAGAHKNHISFIYFQF